MIIVHKRKELSFPDSIAIGEVEYEIELHLSKKRTSSVSVKERNLIFRMSSYLSVKQLEKDFADLLKRIAKKIEKNPSSSLTATFDEVLERGFFDFGKKRYFFMYKQKGRGVKLNNDVFVIGPNSKKENIRKNVVKLLHEEHFPRLKEYIYTLNDQTYQFELKGFELKVLDSKWGHCTPENEIMLNMKLLNAPTEVLNYVIFHELAHIKHKNHSNSFWREVSRFCPNYKQLRKQLRLNPPEVFA